MFSPSTIAMLAGLALVFIGPKKLPELGKALGLGIGNFKKGLQEAQDEVKNAMKADQQPPEKLIETSEVHDLEVRDLEDKNKDAKSG